MNDQVLFYQPIVNNRSNQILRIVPKVKQVKKIRMKLSGNQISIQPVEKTEAKVSHIKDEMTEEKRHTQHSRGSIRVNLKQAPPSMINPKSSEQEQEQEQDIASIEQFFLQRRDNEQDRQLYRSANPYLDVDVKQEDSREEDSREEDSREEDSREEDSREENSREEERIYGLKEKLGFKMARSKLQERQESQELQKRQESQELQELQKEEEEKQPFSEYEIDPNLNVFFDNEIRDENHRVDQVTDPATREVMGAGKRSNRPVVAFRPSISNMIESQLVDVEKNFDIPDPKSVCRSAPTFSTNFKLVNKMINHQRTINSVKGQAVLNKTVENNFSRVKEKPRQIITYGNQLIKPKNLRQRRGRTGEMKEERVGRDDVAQSINQSIFDHQAINKYQTYDIKRLDYYLLARKIEATKGSHGRIFGASYDEIFESSLFDHLKSYYQKAIQQDKIPVREVDRYRFLEGREEIISVLIQGELTCLLEQDKLFTNSGQKTGSSLSQIELRRVNSSINVYVNNHKEILETGYNQVKAIVILDINLASRKISLVLTDNTSRREASTQYQLGVNQLLLVPHLHQLAFDPPFAGQHCIMLVFNWEMLNR